ncbi:hypothetical protein C0991_008774 [Blastosporella zonata]|nr:hypothetical protein C0991_008774 [Blastosporella zonata]
MVNTIRSLAKGASKRYYITAAPQCPFPDVYIGGALDNAFFDAVYVQFYNNYCETSVPSEFNFDTWDEWARTKSPNSDVKIYLGAPASSSAAGNGYVDAPTLAKIAQQAQKEYTSFGGVMLWDADAAYTNNRYDRAIKNALTGGTTISFSASPTLPLTTTTASSSTSLPELKLPFKDPRKTARVKRPQGFTLFQRDPAPTATPAKERIISPRFFRP